MKLQIGNLTYECKELIETTKIDPREGIVKQYNFVLDNNFVYNKNEIENNLTNELKLIGDEESQIIDISNLDFFRFDNTKNTLIFKVL